MELNKRIDGMRDELIKSTQEILKFKSIEEASKPGMPFGEGVAKCLEYALKVSEDLGFKTENLDGYVGYAEYGEGEDYIAVLGHLDVVPEGDGWIYPPYAAEIHDGRIYARGTMDDKGPIMASLYGLKAIADAKLPLTKRIRIIFGTNEETGSKELEYYLAKEKPPVAGFTPDAEFPIIYAEKGLTVFNIEKNLNNQQNSQLKIKSIKGGQRANMVPDYCEAVIAAEDKEAVINNVRLFEKKSGYSLSTEEKKESIVIKSVGVSAHGSVPHLGKNAIMQLLECLEQLPIGEGDIVEFIRFINKHIGMDTTGERFGVGLEDEASGKLSFNVGVISMTDDKISMTLNLRYPVTFKLDDMIVPFKRTIDGTGITIGEISHQEPLYFPEDHPLIKTLQRVYSEHTGDNPKLLAIGGGTYAKEMPNIVAFGPIFPGKPDLDHQANENIEIDDLVLCSKIYAHAMFELAK